MYKREQVQHYFLKAVNLLFILYFIFIYPGKQFRTESYLQVSPEQRAKALSGVEELQGGEK